MRTTYFRSPQHTAITRVNQCCYKIRMVIIIIIQHIRERICSGIGCTYQSISTFIILSKKFVCCTLCQHSIRLSHLFSRNSRRKGCYIRPNPTVKSIHFIYFIPADSYTDMFLYQFVLKQPFCLVICQIRHNAVPYRMRTANRIHIFV